MGSNVKTAVDMDKARQPGQQPDQEANTVLALIAAYNESDIIAETIAAIKSIPTIDRILIVDDGSADETANVAQESGAEVLRLGRNMGKGGALQAAMKEVSQDIVLFLDADLGACASEASKLLEPVLKGEAGMAIADFPKAQKEGGFGLVKGLGRWGILHFTKVAMSEPLSGQRSVKAELLDGVKFENGYGLEVGLTIDVLKKGSKVVEVPVKMTHRETGRDLAGFKHRGKQFLHILTVILKRFLSDTLS
jgi:glycosyltransferase involved in cell wall biosynthesis